MQGKKRRNNRRKVFISIITSNFLTKWGFNLIEMCNENGQYGSYGTFIKKIQMHKKNLSMKSTKHQKPLEDTRFGPHISKWIT